MNISVQMRIYIFMQIRTYTCANTNIFVCIYTSVQMHILIFMQIHIHLYIWKYNIKVTCNKQLTFAELQPLTLMGFKSMGRTVALEKQIILDNHNAFTHSEEPITGTTLVTITNM